MNPKLILVLTVLLMPSFQASADEFSNAHFNAALGIFNLVGSGTDIQINYRGEQSHWQYGLRYVEGRDVFVMRFFENSPHYIDNLTGPVAYYLFRKESKSSLYIGFAWYQWRREEIPPTGPSFSGTSTNLYWGGGYMGHFASSGYFNIGILIAPQAKISTPYLEQSGILDGQLQIGIEF